MDLTRLRKKIDEVDSKIIGLLNDRTRLAREIGRKKIESGKAVYVPEREFEIYQKIEQIAGKGELPGDALKAIYREIMSAALAMEKPLVIAYLGPEATFTHLAALSKFGTSVSYKPCASFAEIFREVEMDRADYGVVPIENSIEGAVNHTLDMFIDSELKICSEIFFEISHNLMTNASSLNQVKRVYSKAEVLVNAGCGLRPIYITRNGWKRRVPRRRPGERPGKTGPRRLAPGWRRPSTIFR